DAASNTMYRGTFFASTCANQQYSLSFYAAFIGNASYQTLCNGLGGFKYPKIKMRVLDGFTGLVITEISTTDIISTSWQQYGLKYLSPASYGSIIIELVNDAPGGCGNDIAIDDIQYGTCDPLPVVDISIPSGGCVGGSTTLSSSLSDPSALPGPKNYQWQISVDSLVWANIAGATSATYTINPVTALNTGKYYRLILAAAGNINSTNCKYISPGYLLVSKSLSTDPTSATRNKNNVCPGNPVTLSVVGGSLGANASWKWYSGSCGGTFVGTGATIVVTPLVATTYYVRGEGDCNMTICRSVSVFISCDIDKDKDGIPDFVESNMPAAFGDADGDGIINAYDIDYAGFVDNNGDFINDNFEADGDSDNDGIPNYLDTDFPGRIDTNGDGVDDRFDADKDGIINMLDLDSDNDGIPDVVEAGGVDADGDGKLDNYSDTDGDGLSQNVDTNNSGAYNSGIGLGLSDLDGDGVPNFIDLDSDNDGIPDVREVGGADANNDGKIDGFIDANGDGISDNILLASALLKTGADTNNDGKADSYPNKNMDKDSRPNPYDVDSDGDGIVDVIEAGLPDVNLDGFVDGVIASNGWSTTISSMGTLTIRNTDADPNPDYLDIDSDNDGITDNIEGPSTAGYFLPSGVDSDKDGLDDAYDNTASFGGHGIFVIDTDGDNLPDYRDLDTDGDGYPDRKEGNDWNFNGLSDENTTLTNVDTDGDGLDDRFDLDNTSAKVTSGNMGNGGTTAGTPFPGTRAVVQKSVPTAGNRDWRWVPSVLPVEFAKFDGTPKGNKTVELTWSVMVSNEVERFEIYRSIDNQNFVLNGTLATTVPANQLKTFYLSNDISDLKSDVIFYRLHVIGKNGEQTISNVIVIRLNPTNALVTLMPNPATESTTIKIQSDKDCFATIRLIDNTGTIVLLKQEKVFRGKNLIQLNGLSKYGSGVYNIQILLNNEIVNTKLGIIK
ncbi:MAG: T9SS type A sorting domain-containing protein, partial [Ginsengibacter sp.]